MAKEIVRKSLIEQILDSMFADIEELEEFDADTVDRLKQLTASGNLKKAPNVIQAIKSVSSGDTQ